MRIRTLLIVMLVMMNLLDHLSAQNKTIDSLKLALKTAKHDTTRANLYIVLGNELMVSISATVISKSDTVISLLQKALSIIQKLPSSIAKLNNVMEKKAIALAAIGSVYYKKSEWPKALDYYYKSLAVFEETGNKKEIASTLNNIGLIYYKQGDITKALDHYNKCLKIQEGIVYKKGIGTTSNSLGAMYYIQGEIDKALYYYNKSLTIFEELGDKDGVARSLNHIGVIFYSQGDIAKALYYYDKSLKIREDMGDKQGVAFCLNNIGIIYSQKGDIHKAIDYFQKNLRIREEIQDKPGIANSLRQIGVIYIGIGDKLRGLDYCKKSLIMCEAIGDKFGIANTLNHIGGIYKDQGDILKALDFYEKSLEMNEAIGDKKAIAFTLNYIGEIFYNQGDITKALTYYQKSLNIMEEMGFKSGITSFLNSLSRIQLRQKKYIEAKTACKRSLQIALELGFPLQTKNASLLLYQTCLKMQQPDSAMQNLTQILNILKKSLSNTYVTLSEKEKELYFTTLEKDYMTYHDFTSCYNNKYPSLTDTAYNISLSNKGLTLKSSTAMRNSILNSGDTALIKSYRNWRDTKIKTSKLYEKGMDTKELDQKANDLEKELVKKSAEFSNFDKVKNLDWRQVQRGLKKGEAAIEFVYFKSDIDTLNPVKYVALIVKPESQHPEMITLCCEADLEKILGTFQGNNFGFVNKVYGTKKQTQTALYEKIWRPMESTLKDVKNVYYSPAGLLHKISFAAISKSNNTYLCDAYKLHQQSSTGKVALPDSVNYSANDAFMLVGAVKYNSAKTTNEIWKYLPGTLSETQNIEKLLKENNHPVNYFVSSNASEGNFKKNISTAIVLHVATHGFFFPDPEVEREKIKKSTEKLTTKEDTTSVSQDIAFRGTTNYANWSFVNNKNPLMRSGLVLANANDVWERDPLTEGEDGILTAQEVSNLDMRNTKLVVLSACETGLGDIKGSEGVYGLQRAFKMAGVKYIIMSLWQVPDAETAEFMEKFYTKLVKTKDIKTSFYQTQKEMRKKYDPFYWAAFVLLE